MLDKSISKFLHTYIINPIIKYFVITTSGYINCFVKWFD